MVTGRLLKVIIAVLTIASLGACSSAGTTSPSAVTTPDASAAPATASSTASSGTPGANPYGTPPPVDPPGPNDALLTIMGGTSGTVTYTLNQLESVGQLRTVTIYEPFVKKNQTFKAVMVKDLFAAAGISGSQFVDTLALNNYKYDDSAANLISSDALIATEVDGQPIPIDQGGPIRLIFKAGTPLSTNLDAWNWSLMQISVIASPTPTA